MRYGPETISSEAQEVLRMLRPGQVRAVMDMAQELDEGAGEEVSGHPALYLGTAAVGAGVRAVQNFIGTSWYNLGERGAGVVAHKNLPDYTTTFQLARWGHRYDAREVSRHDLALRGVLWDEMKKGNIDSDQAAAIYDRRRLVQKGGIVLRMPVVGMVTESKLVVMDVVTPQPIVDFALAARPEIVMGMGVDTEVKISCFWRPWNPPQMYEIDPAQGGLEAKITRVGMVAATANLFTSPEFRGQMDRVVGEASEVMRVDLRSAREMEEILRHIPLPAVTAVIQETLPGALEAHLRTHYGVELMPSSVGVDVRYPPYLTLLSQAQAEAAAQRAKLRVQEEFWGNVADVAASAINKVIDHLGTVVVQAAGAWSPAGYGAVG